MEESQVPGIIQYTVVRSRRRTIELQVKPGGRVVVRAPVRFGDADVERFIQSKRAWISSRVHEALRRAAEHEHEAGQLWYQGQRYPLEVVSGYRSKLDFTSTAFHICEAKLPLKKKLVADWYIRAAKEIITPLLNQLAAEMQLHPKKLSFRDTSSRWGSCAAHGGISLSWRLIMAPPEVCRYVVIHELAHLRHLNHSASFWQQVAAHDPAWRTHRAWLHANGHRLKF